MRRRSRRCAISGNLLPHREPVWLRWPGQVAAVLAVMALLVIGVQHAEKWTTARHDNDATTTLSRTPCPASPREQTQTRVNRRQITRVCVCSPHRQADYRSARAPSQ